MWVVRPTTELRQSFLDFVDEFRGIGEAHFVLEPVLEENGVEAYVAWLADGEAGRLGDEFVPWSAYWLVDPEELEVLAIGSLRHQLSEVLAERGGHIGYRVRPSRRGQGYAQMLLKELLAEARTRGIAPVLAVCHDDNPASAAVLISAGAIEYDSVPDGARQLRRFRF